MLWQPNLNKIDQAHLLTLYEITRAMNSSLDFEEVLNIVMDSMMQVTQAQRLPDDFRRQWTLANSGCTQQW